jgi:hypothetical protein
LSEFISMDWDKESRPRVFQVTSSANNTVNCMWIKLAWNLLLFVLKFWVPSLLYLSRSSLTLLSQTCPVVLSSILLPHSMSTARNGLAWAGTILSGSRGRMGVATLPEVRFPVSQVQVSLTFLKPFWTSQGTGKLAARGNICFGTRGWDQVGESFLWKKCL